MTSVRHLFGTSVTSRMAASALLIGALFVTNVTSKCSANSGATKKLRAVVEGRCLQYTQFVNPDAFCGGNTSVNCSAAAETFIAGFAHQETCNVTLGKFQAFVDATQHPRPADTSMFWEGVYGLVHDYTQKGKRGFTVSDTLTGYMVTQVRFCSDPAQPDGIGGPTTQHCPSFVDTDGCPWNAEYSFWASASGKFASQAVGAITVMLNASTEESFKADTFFSRWELPNLRNVVTRANIWLVHVPGQEVKGTCRDDSLSALSRNLDEKNIPWSCTENPSDVLWLLCWNNRAAAECQALQTSSSASGTVCGNLCTSVLLIMFVLTTVFGSVY